MQAVLIITHELSLFVCLFLGRDGGLFYILCHIFIFHISVTVGTIDVGKARLMFWDLGGQEELQSLWDKVSKKYNKAK